jgi:hypothetical protein
MSLFDIEIMKKMGIEFKLNEKWSGSRAAAKVVAANASRKAAAANANR